MNASASQADRPLPGAARTRLGAYGLELDLSSPLSASLLGPAAPGWPRVAVRQVCGPAEAEDDRLDDERAAIMLAGGARLDIEASSRTAVFTVPTSLSGDELVHPYLAPVAAVFAWWAGREAVHAGAFVVDGRAWAVLGEKGDGKSSTLAGLALAGFGVVCDDMLVVEAGTVLAGPRCLDLRRSAATYFATGIPVLRPPEPRWRMPLGPIAPSVPLAGWIFLEWGADLGITRLRPRDRLARIARNRSMFVRLREPAHLLELATLPAWTVTRPKDWDAFPQAMELVLRAVRGAD
jgi:hypothetical protein